MCAETGGHLLSFGGRKAETEALRTGGETLWSKRRGAEDRFVNSLILHNGCGKKADRADNAFGRIHQSGQFPNASDLGYPHVSRAWGKMVTISICRQSTFTGVRIIQKKKREKRDEAELLTAVSRYANKW